GHCVRQVWGLTAEMAAGGRRHGLGDRARLSSSPSGVKEVLLGRAVDEERDVVGDRGVGEEPLEVMAAEGRDPVRVALESQLPAERLEECGGLRLELRSAGPAGQRGRLVHHEQSARRREVFLSWWASMRLNTSSSTVTASWTCGPLLSITHSARSAIAASVISAREWLPLRTRESRTWVAQITGTWAASQSQRISSWISERRGKPISTARSPRAIITAGGWAPAPRTMIAGHVRTASAGSVFA